MPSVLYCAQAHDQAQEFTKESDIVRHFGAAVSISGVRAPPVQGGWHHIDCGRRHYCRRRGDAWRFATVGDADAIPATNRASLARDAVYGSSDADKRNFVVYENWHRCGKRFGERELSLACAARERTYGSPVYMAKF